MKASNLKQGDYFEYNGWYYFTPNPQQYNFPNKIGVIRINGWWEYLDVNVEVTLINRQITFKATQTFHSKQKIKNMPMGMMFEHYGNIYVKTIHNKMFCLKSDNYPNITFHEWDYASSWIGTIKDEYTIDFSEIDKIEV